MYEKEEESNKKKMKRNKTLLSIVLACAITFGVRGCGNPGTAFDEEIKAKGWAQVAKNKIEYCNGYEAEGFDIDGDGKIDTIELINFYLPNNKGNRCVNYFEVKFPLARKVYVLGDEGFDEIAKNMNVKH